MDEDKQIEAAQVKDMNAEYEKLRKQAGEEIEVYVLLINKKLGIIKKIRLDD